tara:strand:+ start:568 stop:855 length:288 start_codon:yes stop_codon:yes gene_type:complete
MTILIEIIANMKNINSLTNITNSLKKLSEKYNSSLSYSNHEIEGIGHKILKHYYIFSLQFESINDEDYKQLLREIKLIKNIRIENIYNDNKNILK